MDALFPYIMVTAIILLALLTVCVLVRGCNTILDDPEDKAYPKGDWDMEEQKFFLWTLLIHSRNDLTMNPDERIETDHRLLKLCEKIVSSLTPEELELLKKINEPMTHDARALMAMLKPDEQ